MALFNQLDATIQSVVSWLQSMFNFKDIWDTKTALEVDGLKRLPDYIRTELLAKVPPASIKNYLNEYRAKALDGLQAFAKEASIRAPRSFKIHRVGPSFCRRRITGGRPCSSLRRKGPSGAPTSTTPRQTGFWILCCLI